ncbi:MAG: hypothetical protein JW741_09545 [Sedimentisphaerales bacterium]|nr:hypothetical protein [Sedimentisphaerales bacterium]
MPAGKEMPHSRTTSFWDGFSRFVSWVYQCNRCRKRFFSSALGWLGVYNGGRIGGGVVSIGEAYYSCEHHLRMEDACNPEAYFSARDPKRDGVLRFTVIDKQKVPAGHFLEPNADSEEARKVYEEAARRRELSHRQDDG